MVSIREHHRWCVAGIGVVVALTLGGCTGDGRASTASSTASSAASGQASSPVTSPTTGPTGSADGGGASAPGGGTVSDTVAPVEVPALDPVPLDKTADVAGVAVSIDSVKKITLKATSPGDVTGPALAVAVTVMNNTDKPVDVGSAAVTAVWGDGTAGSGSAAEPASPLTGQLAAGKTAKGTYVFSYLGDLVNPVEITVDYAAGTAKAVFKGDV